MERIFTADSDDNPGMVDTEFNITTNSDGSGGSFSISGLSGDDVIYVFPTGSNTNVATRFGSISYNYCWSKRYCSFRTIRSR